MKVTDKCLINVFNEHFIWYYKDVMVIDDYEVKIRMYQFQERKNIVFLLFQEMKLLPYNLLINNKL